MMAYDRGGIGSAVVGGRGQGMRFFDAGVTGQGGSVPGTIISVTSVKWGFTDVTSIRRSL